MQIDSQNIPEIIKAAAQSKLGITALVIVALSIIGIILFRTSPVRVRVGVFILLVVGLMLFAISMTQPIPPPPPPVPSPTPTPTPDDDSTCIQTQSAEIQKSPRNASAFYERGACYQHRKQDGDITRAIDDYSKVIEIYGGTSERADIYQNRGNAYEARGAREDLDRAIEDYTHALLLVESGKRGNSTRLALLKDRGYAYNRNGQPDRMIEDFKTICREAPKSNECSDVKSDIQ